MNKLKVIGGKSPDFIGLGILLDKNTENSNTDWEIGIIVYKWFVGLSYKAAPQPSN